MATLLALIVATPFIIVISVGLAVAAAMWETWWLHPLWLPVLGPLGVPAIEYWHFFALNVFVCSVIQLVPQADYAEDKEQKTVKQFASMAVVYLRPIAAYYVIRWAL